MTQSSAEKIDRLTRELAIRSKRIAQLEGRLCLVCGEPEPCELDKSDMSPCTFDPSPITAARAFLARAVAAERELGEARGWTLSDQRIPEDGAVLAAHPVMSGSFKTWEEAQRLVGHKRSKHALVNLVNWLLLRAETAEAARDKAITEVRRIGDEAVEKLAAAEAEIARLTHGEREAVQDLANALNDKQALEANIAVLMAELEEIEAIIRRFMQTPLFPQP